MSNRSSFLIMVLLFKTMRTLKYVGMEDNHIPLEIVRTYDILMLMKKQEIINIFDNALCCIDKEYLKFCNGVLVTQNANLKGNI